MEEQEHLQDVRGFMRALKARGKIAPADVAALRRLFYEDGVISQWEAETLFELNDAIADRHALWDIFFVEALTDYLVYQAHPRGYVTVGQARWLIDNIARDGLVETETEIELLVNILEKARWSPPVLVVFALEQVRRCVLTGEGPLRDGRVLRRGVIRGAEVDLVRRIIYAFGGDGGVAVSRAEAEMLFEINDAVEGQDNHPAWSELFVQAVANYLMAANGYKVPSRRQMLRREAWLNEPGGLVNFARKAVAGGLAGVREAWRYDPRAEAEARLDRQMAEIAEAEQITADEARWLVERLQRDGVLSESEKRLVRFLRAESPNFSQHLKPLIEEVA